MGIEEIGTLTDALKFGMELEDSIEEFYKTLSKKKGIPDSAKERFADFAEKSNDFRDYLEDKHRDCCCTDMDMGALEPLSEMNTNNYTNNLEIDQSQDLPDIVETAIEAEKKIGKFYIDIGEKSDYISVRETKKIAEKHNSRVSELKDLR